MEKTIENFNSVATISDELQLSAEQIHWQAGRKFMEIGDYNSAIIEFEKGLKISPNDPYCLVGIANVAFKLRKFADAKNVLEIALTKNPEHSEIKNFIKQVDNFLANNFNDLRQYIFSEL
jgi:tetratricopeptide (TPR) repeat protein